MPQMTNKSEIIAYFEEKKQRRTLSGDTYSQALDALLDLLNKAESVTTIKSTVRTLHRNTLKEIQSTENIAVRGELRKQLDLYDDCLTQLRSLPA